MVRAASNTKSNNKKEPSPSETKDINITIIVMPWTLKVKKENEIRLILRFHSFDMDAKSKMTHCILQEIAIATRQEQSNLRGIQILPTTVL